MSGLIPALFVVALFLLAGFLSRKRWLRATLFVILYFCILFSGIAGMGGLRVHIEQARAQGKSEDYVAGMVERNRQLQSARIEILIYSFGMLVLGFAGWIQTPKLHRGSKHKP